MIVGFSLDGIDAEKLASKQGNLNINHAYNVTDVESADVAAFDDAIARIHFEFAVTYQQNNDEVANIGCEGSVLWQEDAEAVLQQWADDESVPDDVNAAVTNHVFRKCLTQAVGIADALDLPSPVPMPQVNQ